MTILPETIIAVATPPGRGGVSVLRISGPHVKDIALSLLQKIPAPRYATFTPFYSDTREIMDQGIALYFPAPHSFTGEDVLELHTHGSPIITDWLSETILKNSGTRLARPGEFSERAFLNGKMDLTEAEAIADLIDASSRNAAKCALRSLQGGFSRHIHQLVASLIQCRTFVEAAIDFSEEEIDFAGDSELSQRVVSLIHQLESVTALATEGSRLCEGMTVVIAGKPNAGKSSLLNCLSGRPTAIVTDIPGTTRDVLRENILLQGLPIQLIDTAGLRHDSPDPIEQEGIRRAKQELATADLVLCVSEAIETPSLANVMKSFSPEAKTLLVRNKIDLTGEKPGILHQEEAGYSVVSLSARTGEGVGLLIEEIRRLASNTGSEGTFSARRRHLDALRRARNNLLSASKQLSAKHSLDCVAEDLRIAQLSLCEVTGEFTPEDLLSEIFSSFCIGK